MKRHSGVTFSINQQLNTLTTLKQEIDCKTIVFTKLLVSQLFFTIGGVISINNSIN